MSQSRHCVSTYPSRRNAVRKTRKMDGQLFGLARRGGALRSFGSPTRIDNSLAGQRISVNDVRAWRRPHLRAVMERGHYSEVHSFLRSNTPRANWTAEQRQFYKRTYSVDKKGNLCDKRTGLQVSQLEDQIPRPNVSKDSASVGISYAASKYGKGREVSSYKKQEAMG
uniref:Uncharacterized protein n=1 Tax=Plectus sambesii TaxID=2011161 RepID=A0A914UX23_9BILA